ncbi:MAG: hypothetical protein RIC55_10795 [Pirellulaceae bacterium]
MSFDPKKAKHVGRLRFEGAWTTSVAFLDDGRKVAAANREGQIYIWRLPEEFVAEQGDKKSDEPPFGPSPVRRLDGHTNGVTQLIAAPDGKTLISSSLDHTVRIWDTSLAVEAKAEAVLDAESREREAAKARNDEPLNRPGVQVELQTECDVLEAHSDWVRALNISADGRRLISGGDDRLTVVWDLAARKEVARWQGHPLTWVVSAALSPDGEKAFVAEFSDSRGSFDRPPAQARIFDATSGSELVDLLKVQFPNVKVRDNSYGYGTTWIKFVGRGFVASEFSPDGKLLAVAQGGETGSGKVHLIDAANGKLVRTFADHQSGALDVRFSSDGEYVLSTGRDTTVQIHQASDGKEVARLGKGRGGQFKDWLHAVALSPDEQWLAAADISGLVELWRFES